MPTRKTRWTEDDIRKMRRQIAGDVLRDFSNSLWMQLWKRAEIDMARRDAEEQEELYPVACPGAAKSGDTSTASGSGRTAGESPPIQAGGDGPLCGEQLTTD